MTHEHGKQVLEDLRGPARELRSLIPETYAGFGAMHKAALAERELDGATKELIALAIGITQQCDGCIASHARGAARQGATRQQVAEMIGVTILMTGGPGTVYGPRALAAFDDFAG